MDLLRVMLFGVKCKKPVMNRDDCLSLACRNPVVQMEKKRAYTCLATRRAKKTGSAVNTFQLEIYSPKVNMCSIASAADVPYPVLCLRIGVYFKRL